MNVIFWYDWLLFPIYAFIVVKLFTAFGKRHYSGVTLKYFKYGLYAKFIGGIIFTIYHIYIYQGGDTVTYYDTGVKVYDFLFSDFSRYISLVFKSTANTAHLFPNVEGTNIFLESNFFPVRVVAVFAIFTFGCYLPITVMFTALSYLGIWYGFRSVTKLFPAMEKYIAISFLFIPSVVLWGTGIGKDSLTFGALCLLCGAAIRVFLFNYKLFKNILLIAIALSILLIIKSYIAYSFIISFSIGLCMQRVMLIQNKSTRIILFPLALIVLGIISYFSYQFFTTNPQFALNVMTENVLLLNKYLGESSGAGSAYDLGIDFENIHGFADLISVFPKSIFITLFRPYLWETKSPAMLLSALESSLLLFLFLKVLFKVKIRKIVSKLLANPFALSCLLFTLIFAGFVGISSGNFGTLVRYKIPCLPFFLLMLFILLYKEDVSKMKKI
jgi:hypothetical protein